MTHRSSVARRYGTFDATSAKNSIHFGYGLPDPQSFDEVKRPEALSTDAGVSRRELLQYSDSGGLPQLRDRVASRHGVTPDSVVITSGASQALQLIADALLDPGDVVVTEDPSYFGALRIFSVAGAEVVQLGMDKDGVDLDALADTLRRRTRVKAFYTAPLFHNPTGRYIKRNRMREVADLLAPHHAMLVQDLVYSELPYETVSPTYLAAGENVINVHSMSKIAAPGLRVGWAIADPARAASLEQLKVDGGVSPLTSNVALALLNDPQLKTHIADLCTLYRHRRDFMHEVLKSCGFCDQTYDLPQGGFSFWVKLADDTVPLALIEDVKRIHDVRLVEGRHYGPTSERYVRLAFSYMPLIKIEEGLHDIDAVYRVLRA